MMFRLLGTTWKQSLLQAAAIRFSQGETQEANPTASPLASASVLRDRDFSSLLRLCSVMKATMPLDAYGYFEPETELPIIAQNETMRVEYDMLYASTRALVERLPVRAYVSNYYRLMGVAGRYERAQSIVYIVYHQRQQRVWNPFFKPPV